MITVNNHEELKKTTADEVKVLCDDGYFGSGQTVIFDRSPIPLQQSCCTRDDGSQMVPRPLSGVPMPPTAPMDHIWKLCSSYMDRPDLFYGNHKTALNDGCAGEIDCSVFAQLILWDIPYEKSVYNGGKINDFGPRFRRNIPKNIACVGGASPRPYGYRASEMAMFFAGQGRLFEMGQDRPDWPTRLQPGDIAFEADPTGQLSSSAIRYLNIIHVVVVLKYEPEYDRMWFVQAGGAHAGAEWKMRRSDGNSFVCNIATVHLKDQGAKWPVFARPAWQ